MRNGRRTRRSCAAGSRNEDDRNFWSQQINLDEKGRYTGALSLFFLLSTLSKNNGVRKRSQCHIIGHRCVFMPCNEAKWCCSTNTRHIRRSVEPFLPSLQRSAQARIIWLNCSIGLPNQGQCTNPRLHRRSSQTFPAPLTRTKNPSVDAAGNLLYSPWRRVSWGTSPISPARPFLEMDVSQRTTIVQRHAQEGISSSHRINSRCVAYSQCGEWKVVASSM